MTIRKVGVDPGFGFVKVAEVQSNGNGPARIAAFVLPSQVGIARKQKAELSTGLVRGRRQRTPYRVEFEGVEWLVGPNVNEYTRSIHRMDLDRFSDSPELRAGLYAALYPLVNGGSHRLALALALPVEAVQEPRRAAGLERSIRGWLMGEHLFHVNGVETVLAIEDVRCKIPQPVASWFEWGLDTNGRWIRGDEALKAPAVIIDEGFNTLDVLLVEGGKISQRRGGDMLGMRRAAEQLSETVAEKYGVRLELSQANELVQGVVNGQAAQTYVAGQVVDVSAEARQALRTLATEVVEFADRVIGAMGGAARVLLTGGGALAMAGRFVQRYPHAEVMYEPALANARGLAKMAIRSGFLAKDEA